ncbi:alpha/beta hydrolase [Lichenicola sp.]|uniref:alpha/beta hydrolase n=1 Tax=Lichenicola sp. TaxID=2804529 RepID=UPI003B00E346
MSLPETAATGVPLTRRLFSALGSSAALLAAGCSPVRLLNTLAPDRLAADGIAYGADSRQRLDIYRPAGIPPFPVLVFLYGGSWDSGARGIYRFLGGAFAAHGFMTVVPDYRLFPEVRYPTFLQDCAAAMAWTRRNIAAYGGSSAAPTLMGHSAGAYNAAMLTLDPALLEAVGLSPRHDIGRMIGLAGPYDFLPLDTDELRAIFGPPAGLPATQPINHADGGNPPMLLLAGTADHTVRPGNTVRLAGRIHARGGPVSYRLYPGVDHLEIVGAISGALRFLAPTFGDSLAFMQGDA